MSDIMGAGATGTGGMIYGGPGLQQGVGGAPLPGQNPLIGALLSIASMLGIDPMQLAAGVAQNPEGAAATFDTVGLPGPDDAAAATAPPAPVGGALIGSEPIDYADDPLRPATNIIPGIGDANAAAGLSLLPEQDPGVAAPSNAPPPTGTPLDAILSGVQPPPAPQVPQIATPSPPSPRGLQPTTMDEIIRAALSVASPQASQLTLNSALARR